MNSNLELINKFEFITELMILANSLGFEIKHYSTNYNFDFKAQRGNLIIEVKPRIDHARTIPLFLEIKEYSETTDENVKFDTDRGSYYPQSGESYHYGCNIISGICLKRESNEDLYDFNVFRKFLNDYFITEIRDKNIESILD